jgi:hypothetical protein
MRLPDKCPVGHSRLPHCNGASEHHTNRKIYLFACACMCFFVCKHMIARAIAIVRTCAETGPLRTRTQRSRSCALIACVNKHGMRCLTRMFCMQSFDSCPVRRASSSRGFQGDSMEEPTATQDRGKQFEPHLYTYIECAHMLESCMNALLMLLCMHPSHRTLASVGPGRRRPA